MIKMEKRILGVLVCVLMIATVFPTVAIGSEELVYSLRQINCDYLEINVTTDKQSYQKGEPVNIIITNVDEVPMLGFPYLDIYNVSANDLVFWARPVDMPDLCQLDPGESQNYTWNQKDMHENQVDVGEYMVLFTLMACFGPVARDNAKFMIFDRSLNEPPNQPTKPSGKTNGETGTSYSYSSSTTDPEGNQIYYMFDWDDGTNSGWIGPFDPGQPASESHIWNAQGSYQIKVKAKDEYNAESDWSDPLPVSMPKIYENTLLALLEKLNEWFMQAFGREILSWAFNL